MQKGKQPQKKNTQTKKSLYIHTGWFQTADQKSIKQLLDQQLTKLQIEFNSYGIIDQNTYFTKYHKILCHFLQNYQKSLSDFKFKFIGWDQVNPWALQQIINKTIKPENISLNYSNIRGSRRLFISILNKLFDVTTKYSTIHLNFANWKFNFELFKQISRYHLVNDVKKFHLEISGWGKNINDFFNINTNEERQMKTQLDKKLNQFNIFLKEYFLDQLIKSVEEEIRLDMRFWHEGFKLKELKSNLDNFLKEGCAQQSLMTMTKQTKPIFKFIFIV